ncbi:MAG: heme-dependent oxidative N-demethylase subunit alpha family protein, partial [Pseudomonadota bacterium]
MPVAPWLSAPSWRLPGVRAQEPTGWLFCDDAFAGQMAERDRLIEERPVQVLRMLPEAIEAARECLHLVLEHLRLTAGYRVSNGHVVRPDGARVMISEDEPLRTLGRLIQEDICILQPGPAGHRLTGAVLCFPASWTLAEKIGHPLIRIHAPVGEYDDRIAQSV